VRITRTLLQGIQDHPTRAALGGFSLLAMLFYAPLLLGLRTFPDGDFTHHFLPFSLFQLAALRAWHLPIWNPYTYAGHPFLADPQAAVFYPLSNFLLILTAPWSSPGARLYFLQVEALIQVALAGFFVYLLVEALVQNRWAAFTAGCAFAFSGYLIGYPPLQLAILRTALWLPCLLWLLHRGFAAPTQWRWWIGAGLAGATMIFAGHPQTWLHGGYVVGAWCVVRGVWGVGRRAWGVGRGAWDVSRLIRIPHSAFRVTISLLIALGVSAAQLWPSLEFTQLSVRANVDYAFVSGGLPLQDSWQVLLPGVLTQFSPLYVGVAGLGLAALGVVSVWVLGRAADEPWDRVALLFFCALALIGLLLAYGDHAFLYPLFYWLAPGWKLFRGQERAALLVALGLSVLIGYGAAAVPRLPLIIRQRVALLYLAVVTVAVYGFGLFWQLPGRTAIANGRYLLLALITLTLTVALVVPLRLPGWSRRRSVLVTALVIANLFWAGGTTNLDRFGPARKTILAPEVVALEQAVQDRATANLGLPGRTYNEFRVYEDYGMRSGLEDVWGSSPLRLARYALLFDQFPLDRLWRLTGVEHLLTWRRELFEPSTLLGEFPQSADTTYLHRLTEPNPRAWLVSQLQPATDDEAVRLLGDHNFDLEQIALLPPEQLTDPVALPASGDTTIHLARPAPERLAVQMESEGGGLLLISENWMPGWQVRAATCGTPEGACDGLQSPLANLQFFTPYRANLSFVGLLVPAGPVRFELHYWPTSVRNGLWVSGATLLLLLIVVAGRGWQRGRSW
jgi:hypothetical protein